MQKSPYLSIVISARNDDHGGNMLKRLQTSLNGLFEQFERHKIESEIILIDWNPPKDKAFLKEVLNWPKKLHYCTVRVFVVPPSLHDKCKDHHIRPLLTAFSQNLGFRGARGEFILPGAVDLLYTEEIMAFIAQKKLKKDERYRINRCDVYREVLSEKTLKEQLEFCKKNIFHVQEPLYNNIKGFPDLHANACGDFQLMHRYYWHLLRGYRESNVSAVYADGLLSYASYAAGVKEVFIDDPKYVVFHIDHDGKWGSRVKPVEYPFIKWLNLNRVLPPFFKKVLYHLYYETINRRPKNIVDGVETIGYGDYLDMCKRMLKGKQSFVFNDENWGLKDKENEIREFRINTADWDKE